MFAGNPCDSCGPASLSKLISDARMGFFSFLGELSRAKEHKDMCSVQHETLPYNVVSDKASAITQDRMYLACRFCFSPVDNRDKREGKASFVINCFVVLTPFVSFYFLLHLLSF